MNNSGQQRRLWVPPGSFSTLPRHPATDAEDILNTYLKTTGLKGTSNKLLSSPGSPCTSVWPCLSQGHLSRKHQPGILCINAIRAHTLKQGFLDSESDSATPVLGAFLPSQSRDLMTKETRGWDGSHAHK